jgi:hypothetical protein
MFFVVGLAEAQVNFSGWFHGPVLGVMFAF